MCHSQRIDTFGAQLDFQGVILLMWGAGVPLIYYGFERDAWLRKWYWGLGTQNPKLTILALACSISTFRPGFRNPYLRPIRALTFGSLALFFLVPIAHGIVKYGWVVQNQRMGIVWVLMTLGLNTTGAVAYAFKVPERFCRRTFDVVGASHQIFHVLVVVAALVYLRGLLQAFDFVHLPLHHAAASS
ncbi:hemolysin III family channel protein [Phlyctema vagabunda]|uniref:Hemolysin III family channel protein n=1 Tax=Phlyctema vagabunda TaxID=108571 RepID=A0ABR4PKA9_9HELO